jgi:hypothetical protein
VPVEELASWYDHPPTGNRSGFTFWVSQHNTWVSLAIRSVLAAALATSTWEVVGCLATLEVPIEREHSPLLANTGFLYPGGYGGNAGVAFTDFLTYLEHRHLDELVAVAGMDAIGLACGTDLYLGMRRCAWEASQGTDVGRVGPQAYASYATYQCDRIRWVASRLHHSEAATATLGLTLEEFRSEVVDWYPALTRRHNQSEFSITCDTWAGAAGLRPE